MADTTPERVQAIAKHLKNIDTITIQMYIDDAKVELAEYKAPAQYQEKLQRYLAAHFATLDYRRPSNQRIGDLQTSYNAAGGAPESRDFDTTEYGQEFKRLLRNANGPLLAVI